MFYSIRGKLIHKELNLAVVECGGVGYACRTSASTISSVGALGSEVTLYTHLYVREDTIELFGFSTPQELNCFRLLISVTGVGPKAAIAILSDVTPESFAFLVASGNSKAFTGTKGIGAKTAQRIVLELKDKLSPESLSADTFTADTGATPAGQSSSSSMSEALEALSVLGYSGAETAPVLGRLDPASDTQTLIKEALRIMSEKRKR